MSKIAPVACALFCSAFIHAQDGARSIVEKAIQAQGGEAKVAKLKIMRIKAEGTAAVLPGQPDLLFTIEDIWQMPNWYKTTSTFQLAGQKISQTQVIDGHKGWIQMNGHTQDMPKDTIAEMKEQKYAEDLDRYPRNPQDLLRKSKILFCELNPAQVFGRQSKPTMTPTPTESPGQSSFDDALAIRPDLMFRANEVWRRFREI